jgi:DNA-binding Lrp family transcriptional regulator
MHKNDLDRIDIDILRTLLNNARASNKEIAAATGLAPSSCHERLKRLRKSGVLAGTHVDIDLKSIGFHLEALLFIELARQQRDAVERLMMDIESIPEFRRVFVVAGRYDLLIHCVARDVDHVRKLEYEHLTSRTAVSRIETLIVFESRIHHELPLPEPVNPPGQERRPARKSRRKA